MRLFKRVFIMACVVMTLSCQSTTKEPTPKITLKDQTQYSPFDTGETLFKGKGKCYSCHQLEKKSIGPSVADIVAIYTKEKGDMIAFLRGNADPIVDPEQYSIMKTNFTILNTFSDQELEALTTYMNHIVTP